MDTRLLPLGYTRSGTPVYPVWGAMDVEPDEPDEPEEGDDPQDDPEGSDEGGKKDKGKKGEEGRYVPPSEAEWARVRSSLDRANASAKEKRLKAAELERRNRELEDRIAAREAEEERRKLLEQQRPQQLPADAGGKRGKSQPGPTQQPSADLPAGVLTPAQVKQQLAQARRAEREAVVSEYQDMARRSAARVALSEAQVPKTSIGRLVKLLDLEEIELDADGEVVGGLDEQIDQLKAELPQLFAALAPDPEPKKETKPRPRPPRIPNANGSGRQPAPERMLSTAEQMAASILGDR